MISLFSINNTALTIPDVQLMPMSCELTEELNGLWQVVMEYSTADDRYRNIIENAVLSIPTPQGKNQLYRIYNTVKTTNSVIAYALPIFTDAGREVVLLDTRPTNRTGQQALDIMTAGTKYSGESDITDVSTAYYVRKNLLDAISGDSDNAFLKRWGGEIIYDNYKIIINKSAGKDRGMRVEFGFNMQEITEDVSTVDTVTRIIPVAYNGRTLDGDRPWIDSPLIDRYPVIYTKIIEYNDIRLASDNNGEGYATIEALQAALRQRAEAEYANGIDLPTINYSVDLVDLASTKEYEQYKHLVKISLGDIVKCKNKRLNIETTAKAIKVVYDCILQRITAVELGDYRKSYFDKLSVYAGQTASTTTNNGETKGETISGIIDMMVTKLKAARDKGEIQSEHAILFEDNDEESMTYGAMTIGTTGFEIASRKDKDGEWIWRTFGTGEGFYADAIIAGILYSQNYTEGQQGFKIDLNTGDIYAARLNYYGKELGVYIEDAIDESIMGGEMYVVDEAPTLSNYPASTWHKPLYPASDLYAPQIWDYSDIENYYRPHHGDMAFDAVSGLLYIFKRKDDGSYEWELQEANATKYVMHQLTELKVENGRIASNVEELSAELRDNYWTVEESRSAIEQTSQYIQSTVEKKYTTLTETATLRSQVTQTAEAIKTKVSKGTVSSEISQESDLISISSDRFKLDSTYTSISEGGIIQSNAMIVTGGYMELQSASGYVPQIKLINSDELFYCDLNSAQITFETDTDRAYINSHTVSSTMGYFENLAVTGQKNRLVPTKDYGDVVMNAMESLGAFFVDVGSAIIDEGSVVVAIDDRMSVTTTSEYYILTTVTQGYIERIDKHNGYFVAYGNGKFDFMVIAKQRGYNDVYGDSTYNIEKPKQDIPLTPVEMYANTLATDYMRLYDDILAEEGVI